MMGSSSPTSASASASSSAAPSGVFVSMRQVRLILALVALALVFQQSKTSLASEAYFSQAMDSIHVQSQEIADGTAAAVSTGSRRATKQEEADEESKDASGILDFQFKPNLLSPTPKTNQPSISAHQGQRFNLTAAKLKHPEHENADISENGEETTPTKSTAASETSVASTAIEKASKPSGCYPIIQRMHEWNDCWRQHAMRIQHNENAPIEKMMCAIHDRDNNIAKETIGAPLYHIALYKGQGFGRLIQHTVEACAVAFLLKRPCLINMSPRDPHFTWRSFIQQNTYNWDTSLLHNTFPKIRDQLEQLAQLLPHTGAGSWGSEQVVWNFTHHGDSLAFDSPVLPMQHKVNRVNYTMDMQYYTVPSQRQVLLSPNWADAWFTRVPMKTLYEKQYHCNFETLKTLLQNAMYGPTDLALQLHQSKFDGALDSGKWERSSKEATTELKQSFLVPHTLVADDASQNLRKNFGSVHVRVHFLNEKRKTPIDKGEIVTMIRRCLLKTKQMIDKNKKSKTLSLPDNWWLLADDPNIAVETMGGMGRRQRSQEKKEFTNNPLFNQSIPLVKWYHNYTFTEDYAAQKAGESVPPKRFKEFSSKHSMSPAARGLFGHANMAGAIQDWMALAESQIAIVVSAGSFGATGARGNGKVPRAYCGGPESTKGGMERNHFQIFY